MYYYGRLKARYPFGVISASSAYCTVVIIDEEAPVYSSRLDLLTLSRVMTDR